MDTSGSLNAALIIWFKICGPAAVKIDARSGFVDHTREETVDESGRKAIGPVGRKRW